MRLWMLLDINPEPWAIGPVGSARRGGKLTSYVGRNAQLHAYEEAVKEEVQSQLPTDFKMYEGKVLLRMYFWRNRAEYVTPQARTHRKHEADLTNMQKATEDALQGVLFKNDKDVAAIHSIIMNQGPEVEGTIVLCIESMTPEIMGKIKMSIPDDVLYKNFTDKVAPTDSSWPPVKEDSDLF